MIDEPHDNETSEQPEQEDLPQGDTAQPAGPVAEEDSSSSPKAAGDEPTSAPPAGEADQAEGGPTAEGSSEESPEAEGEPAAEAESEESAEVEQEESEAEGQAGQEEPEGEGKAHEEEPEEAATAGERKAAEKGGKDVIPGADLEPIAVEPEERPLSAEEQARREAEEEERRQREEALAAVSEAEEPAAASRAPAKLEGDARFLATGKRKRSIARVILLPGTGSIEVNRRPLEEFFPRPLHQTMARQPLAATGYEGNVDVRVRVHGGGVSGQAGAVRHGIARALTEVDPELRGELKRRGFLTRDARVKERRKAGLKKARKRPQFSKR